MTDKSGLQFRLKTAAGEVVIPENSTFSLKNEGNAIFPYNLDMNGVKLTYATAQLLTRFTIGKKSHYVFFAPEGIVPEFSIAKSKGVSLLASGWAKVEQNKSRWLLRGPEKGMTEFTLRQADSMQVVVLVVDYKTALTAWEANINDEPHLVFSSSTVLPDEKGYTLLSEGKADFTLSVYPKITATPKLDVGKMVTENGSEPMTKYRVRLPEQTLDLASQKVGESKLVLPVPERLPTGLNDIFAQIDYTGDTGMGFLDGKLVTDEFYKGLPWQVGLKRFVDGKSVREMTFYFRPIYRNASFLVDIPAQAIPDFGSNGRFLSIGAVKFVPEYRAGVQF